MKKNLILLIITVSIGSIAYYFEEYKPLIIKEEKVVARQLLDFNKLGPLNKIILPNVTLEFSENTWHTSKARKLSEQSISNLFKFLEYFKIKKKLQTSELKMIANFYSQFDKNKFRLNFKKENVVISIGNKIAFSHDFYLKLQIKNKTSYAIATYDILISRAIRREEYSRSDFQYNKLKDWLRVTDDYFYDKVIFKEKIITKIHFLNRNKPFSFFFKSNTIKPALNNLKYNDVWIKLFKARLLSLKANRIYFIFDKNKLQNKLATLTINNKIEYELYQKLGSLEGYFVYQNGTKILFEINKKNARFFFYGSTDFYKLNFEQEFELYKKNGFWFKNKHFYLNLKKKAHHFLAFYLIKKGTISKRKPMPSPLYKLKSNHRVLSFYKKKAEVVICRQETSFCLAYKEDSKYKFPVNFSND